MHPDRVRLAAPTSLWAASFEREKASLKRALGASALAIEHVGSTSVPGLVAKPVVDIAVAVASFEGFARCVGHVEALGYAYRGEYGIARRHYFVKGTPRTHHLHALEAGSANWANHLLFRDYLRRYPETAARYADLKTALAHTHDRAAYTEAKGPFIRDVLRRAASEASTPGLGAPPPVPA